MPTRQELETALRKAYAKAETGDQQAAEYAKRIGAAIENEEFDEVSNDAVSFLQGAGQGVTLGGSDEFMSMLAAAFPTLAVGEGDIAMPEGNFLGRLASRYGANYDDALASTRADIKTAREEDPWLTFGGELTGGLLTGGAGGARAVAGKSLAQGAKALAGTGMLYGAGAGYGYSENDPLRALTEGDKEKFKTEAIGALQDAAVGGGSGMLLGYSMPWLGAGVRALGKYVYGLSPDGKQVMFNEKAKKALIDAYKADVAGGYITPQKAMQELKDIPELVVGDLGPNLRNEMMRLGQLNTAGGSGIRQFVIDRNRGQFDRLYPKLAKMLTGEADPNFGVLQRDLIAQKRANANAMYGAIGDKPAVIDNAMRNVLKNPQAKKALKHANMLREIEGKPPIDTKNILQEQLTTDELHSIISGFRSVTDSLFKGKGGSGNIAAAYKKNLYQPFRDSAYQLNSDLAEAQKVWRDDTMIEEALDAGRKIFRENYEVSQLLMDDMADAEMSAFKMGVVNAFRDAMDNRSFDADLLKTISNSRRKEKILETVFGNKAQFREFMDYLANEDKMFQTMKDATSNSLTARRLLQQNPEIGQKFLTQIGYNVGLGRQNQQPIGVGPRLSAFAFETAGELINPEAERLLRAHQIADLQAGMLLGKDLKGVTTPNTVGGLLDTGVPRLPAVAVPGLLSTGGLHEDYGYSP